MMRILAAFEGGGAKGIAHVGALRAIETAHLARADVETGQPIAEAFTFTGVAGTSAGAIVAALVAAGYRADDIIAPNPGPDGRMRTILTRLGEITNKDVRDATGLLGSRSWWFIGGLRFLLRRPVWLFVPVAVFFAAAAHLGLAAFSSLRPLLGLWVDARWAFGLAALVGVGTSLAVLGMLAWLVGRWLQAGLASSDTLIDGLEALLADKLDISGRAVRFSDFGGATGRPTLKIVATDVTHAEVRLFSPETTPNVSVARAVAASACLPVVFHPVMIEDRLYLDGGLMSNLPVWTFDVERTLDCDAQTLAFEIVDAETSAARRPSAANWLGRLARGVIFSRAFLNKRAIPRLETIRLPVPSEGEDAVGVLDFDVDAKVVGDLVARTAAITNTRVLVRFGVERAFYLDAGQRVQTLVMNALDRTPQLTRRRAIDGPMPRVRVAIAVPEGSDDERAIFPHQDVRAVDLFRLRRECGFDDDTDERLDLPLATSIVGKAWQNATDPRAPGYVLELLRGAGGAPVPNPSDLDDAGSRIRKKLLWPELAFVLAIPIFDEAGERVFVVSVDGNDLLDPDAPELMPTFNRLAAAIYGIYRDGLRKLSKVEQDLVAKSSNGQNSIG